VAILEHRVYTAFGKARARVSGSALAIAALALFCVNFNVYALPGSDARVYYGFLRRLFDGNVPAYGYNFGTAFSYVPFYGLGTALDHIGLHHLAGQPVVPAVVALGSSVYAIGAAGMAMIVIAALGYRHAGLITLAALLGTPLVFYATFFPGQTHTQDTFFITVAIAALFWALKRPSTVTLPILIGASLGFAASVRYFNAFPALAVFVGLLACKRVRTAAIVGLSFAMTSGLLAGITASRGVSFVIANPIGSSNPQGAINFYPLNPLRMLFTDKAGLLVWSPIVVLAIIGYVRILKSRPEHRTFLVITAAMGIALIASYALFSDWIGGWGLSQRYFTALFPTVAIGLAGLSDWRPAIVAPVAACAVAWSLFLCFNVVTLGRHYTEKTEQGAVGMAKEYSQQHSSVGSYAWGLCHKGLTRLLVSGCR
jgi:hypothetical protein